MSIKLLPFENIVLTTLFSPEEVNNILIENIHDRALIKNFLKFNFQKKFIGNSTIGQFRIRRVISYKNSFLPFAYGKVYKIASKTHIDVVVKPLTWVLMVSVILIPFISIIVFTAQNILPGDGLEANFNKWFPLVFPIIFYAVVIILFNYECKKIKSFLKTTLDAVETKL